MLAKLAEEPWNMGLLKELHKVGLQRIANGDHSIRLRWRRPAEDFARLLERYRDMAYSPLQAQPLIEIVRQIARMEESLPEQEKDAAERVSKWAEDLVRRMDEGRWWCVW